MAAHTAGPQVSPFRLFNTLNAYQQTMALKAAVELEVFTHIADGAVTAADIAARCQASERGIRILCDFLTVSEFLTKSGNTYGLTPESGAFLNKRSPAYLGSMAEFLAHPHHVAHFADITAAIRKGGAVDMGNMGPDDPVWVEFARSMAPMMRGPAKMIAPMVTEPGRPDKVLDIAAGHGLYGIAVATLNPVAEVYAVDWGIVLTLAAENAAAAGVANRFHTIPGSAFDVDFGRDYDVILMPAFLHHFDAPTNIGLLKKARAAMKPGGLLAVCEFMPNEDRVSPPMEATFSMMMLCSTPAGDAYTYRELEAMCREAGFGPCQQRELPGLPFKVLLSHA